jgi:UDP-N-acetylmuramate--alanine ligase
VDAQALVREIGRSGVEYAGSVPAAIDRLVEEAREGDVIMTLGAGNVSQAGAMLLEALAG